MQPEYGYNGRLDSIRSQYNFSGVYLDNAAAPLVARSVALEAAEYIVANPLVNPHSRSYWAQKTLEMVDETRKAFLNLLGTASSEYELVFTQNATHALKLVGECMADFHFTYLIDSHTSVVGLRSLAKSFSAVRQIAPAELSGKSVVSWPLQSNFDGTRYPGQKWADFVAARGGISLVDLAAFCSTTMPDFGSFKPDLAVVSFYKIFGLPDLGGLLIRRTPKLQQFFQLRRYAGGGTVALITPVQNNVVRQPDLASSLEDGTIPFHSIATLKVAMAKFQELYGGFDAISFHTTALTEYCRSFLEQLGYCRIWSDKNQGPILTFTLKTTGYQEFANVCSKLNIHVRTGTLCNIGAFTLKSQIKDADLLHFHKARGKTCSDEQDIIDGLDTGVIRVSFGPYSSQKDVDQLIETIKQYFGPTAPDIHSSGAQANAATIKRLAIYPIKSCAALYVNESIVTAKGLQWDREFCLINPNSGKVYSLKKAHVMNNIHSQLTASSLTISFSNRSINVPLDVSLWPAATNDAVKFCADRAAGMHINLDPALIEFLSEILESPCTLARIVDTEARNSHNVSSIADTPLSLSNSSPILLVSATSAKDLDAELGVFRANIIVDAENPWAEDSWAQLRLGESYLDVLGPCRRCNMVCVRPNGTSDPDAYLKLTKTRRYHGKLWFGQHVQSRGDEFAIKLGDSLACVREKEPVYVEL